MRNRNVRNYPISDFIEWFDRGELKLTPWFQRRDVWSDNARSYLIDTILRNLPIPVLIIRLSRDPRTGSNLREVVDGQQRLRAIFDFYNGSVNIKRIHNEDLDGCTFNDLSKDGRSIFLDYELAVNILTGATNAEVLDIFARLNSYTIVLNRQEKLNAKFHGDFKTFIYRKSNDYVDYLTENRILSNKRILRMGEAELFSELVIMMLDGLQDKKKSIQSFYLEYDNSFPLKNEISNKIDEIISIIDSIFAEDLKNTYFRRPAIFYSLYGVIFDLRYGMVRQEGRNRFNLLEYDLNEIKNKIMILNHQISLDEPDEDYVEFVLSSTRQTDNIKPRQVRHRIIKNKILEAIT